MRVLLAILAVSCLTWMASAASSCRDILLENPTTPSGLQSIVTRESGLSLDVMCDMDFEGGGWTRVFAHNFSAGLFPTIEANNGSKVTTFNADQPLDGRFVESMCSVRV